MWPMRRSPRARKVPRCLGLAPMAERTWVTTSWVMSADLVGHVRATLGLAVRLEQALGDELLGRQATQAGDLVGPLQVLEARDGGPRDVDVVRRPQRLAEHVADAGLF